MTDTTAPYREAPPARRIRIPDLQQAKERGERWAMLTSYDTYTAAMFEQAGVWALLVGDSAANNVYGYETTLPETVDELSRHLFRLVPTAVAGGVDDPTPPRGRLQLVRP